MKRFFTFILVFVLFAGLITSVAYTPVSRALLDGDMGDGNDPISGDTGGSSYQLQNPLGYDNVCTLLTAITDLVVEIAAIIAVIMIIWVGLRFVRAQGEPKALQDAKNAFLNTIIGTAILLGASVIAKVVVNTILSITKASGNSTC